MTDAPDPRLPSLPRGTRTYALGVAVTLFSVLVGVDWSLVFTRPETVAAVGTGMVFARAVVSLFAALDKANDASQ